MTVLLTGATGFLGRHMLCELLASGAKVICIVRASSQGDASHRLAVALAGARPGNMPSPARLETLCGDVTEPRFGLSPEAYEAIANNVEAIYHCAAEVNWIKNYAQLRRVNVTGTLELIRFACHGRAKRFTFVSSLAVCFAREGPAIIEENTDMAPWRDAMPLGYAQSKCVAESLLRQAAVRGLPVVIVRPGLLSGDTVTGQANPTDVVGAVIQGCVERGEAPDEDWLFDIVPVDYAARAIVALSQGHRHGLVSYHVRHARPRHWRELVLWLHLLGYPMRFVPTGKWLEQVFAEGRRSVLSSYRRFFLGARASGEQRPFEIYMAPAQATVDCDRTRTRLRVLGIDEPPLDCALLRRYIDHYATIGVLPPRRTAVESANTLPHRSLRQSVAASCGFAQGGRELCWERQPFDGYAGLLHEIAAIRLGATVGLDRYRVSAFDGAGNSLDILVKAKARDSVIEGLLVEIASLCSPALGRELRTYPEALGLRGSHRREVAIYRDAAAPFSAHLPCCFGVCEDNENASWSIAMEHLAGAEFPEATAWSVRHIDAAIEAAATLHAVWFAREPDLHGQSWLPPEIDTGEYAATTVLWQAFAEFSEPGFSAWAGTSLGPRQTQLINCKGTRRAELQAMPQTLIHNDFNPRNLAFTVKNGEPHLIAFDWELARIGVPQHDLAELLCFVFPAHGRREDLARWLELHRARLSLKAGIAIEQRAWVRGFVLALQQIMVERLPLYAMAHRFKPQPFLPTVMRNWVRLYEQSLSLESSRGSVRAA